MRAALFPLVALCACVMAVASTDPEVTLPGVSDLTPENFDTIVDGKRGALVEFYAPWCGHCKSMTPEFKKLGEIVQTDSLLKNRVVVAKVNADKHSSLGERFGVQGFPTIKYFPRGSTEPEDYNGGRKSKAFASFLKKKVEEDQGLGRVEALDELVKDFVASDNKDAIVKSVADKVKSLEGGEQEDGQIYEALLGKVVAKGNEYLVTEKARLEKVLASGNVASTKAVQMAKKVSIIKVLLGEADQ